MQQSGGHPAGEFHGLVWSAVTIGTEAAPCPTAGRAGPSPTRREVDARFGKRNGCEIARFEKVKPVVDAAAPGP